MLKKLPALGLLFVFVFWASHLFASDKKLAYIVSDIRIPFWEIMSRGIQEKANSLGYEVQIYSAHNQAKKELEYSAKAIHDEVEGIIISPTSSFACSTILGLANKADIPVVISDIGTDSGEYVSYISSDNKQGAYEIGKVLGKKMQKLHMSHKRVGIISIPQKRKNGQLRTQGFMKAMSEYGIKGADIKQQVTFSYQETYDFAMELIKSYPDLGALWLQGSDRYQGALDAIKHSGKKDEVLLLTFDAEPEFLELIPQGVLVGAAMQQPFLMGQKSVSTLHAHLSGKSVPKQIQLEILPISAHNIAQKLPTIRRNVLGLTPKK